MSRFLAPMKTVPFPQGEPSDDGWKMAKSTQGAPEMSLYRSHPISFIVFLRFSAQPITPFLFGHLRTLTSVRDWVVTGRGTWEGEERPSNT